MTQKLNTDNGLQAPWTRTPAPNRRLAKVAVQCSADSFVVNQTLVLRINICGINRHLRQAPNRYRIWSIKFTIPKGKAASSQFGRLTD